MTHSIIVPFRSGHVHALDLQPSQTYVKELLAGVDLSALEGPAASTLLDSDLRPIACAGILPKWEGVGFLWSFLSNQLGGKNFLSFHRVAMRFLSQHPFPRLEAAVEVGFDEGDRWMAALGFVRETAVPARKYMHGRDFHLYARVV